MHVLDSTLSERDIDVNSNLMLIGDLNAKTASRCDFITRNKNAIEFEAVVDILDNSHLNLRRTRLVCIC